MLIIENQERLAKIALEQPNTRFERLFRYVSDPFWLVTAADGITHNSRAMSAGVDAVGDIYALANQLSDELKAGTY